MAAREPTTEFAPNVLRACMTQKRDLSTIALFTEKSRRLLQKAIDFFQALTCLSLTAMAKYLTTAMCCCTGVDQLLLAGAMLYGDIALPFALPFQDAI